MDIWGDRKATARREESPAGSSSPQRLRCSRRRSYIPTTVPRTTSIQISPLAPLGRNDRGGSVEMTVRRSVAIGLPLERLTVILSAAKDLCGSLGHTIRRLGQKDRVAK